MLVEQLSSLRAEVAALRAEVVDKLGGQLRLERIETTRVIGSDLEALQHEIRRLAAARPDSLAALGAAGGRPAGTGAGRPGAARPSRPGLPLRRRVRRAGRAGCRTPSWSSSRRRPPSCRGAAASRPEPGATRSPACPVEPGAGRPRT